MKTQKNILSPSNPREAIIAETVKVGKVPSFLEACTTLKAKSIRWLKQVKEQGLLTMECPECKGHFGLDRDFVEAALETNCHYSCPYCHSEHGLEN